MKRLLMACILFLLHLSLSQGGDNIKIVKVTPETVVQNHFVFDVKVTDSKDMQNVVVSVSTNSTNSLFGFVQAHLVVRDDKGEPVAHVEFGATPVTNQILKFALLRSHIPNSGLDFQVVVTNASFDGKDLESLFNGDNTMDQYYYQLSLGQFVKNSTRPKPSTTRNTPGRK